MTVGELRNMIAGVPPDTPVIDTEYRRVTARWQQMVREDLTGDVTLEQATKGKGITCLVIKHDKTEHRLGESVPTRPNRGIET